MGLSLKPPPGKVPKTFKPGNVYAKVDSITLEKDKFNPDGYFVRLLLESVDLGPKFEGFNVDPKDLQKGRYKGQIGNVNTTLYAYSNGKKKNGDEVNRDAEIIKMFAALAKALDFEEWSEANEGKHNTIESLFNQLDKDKPYLDKFIYWCLAGKEYEKGGYINYNLFLARNDYDNKKFSFAVEEDDVVKFESAKHIVKKKAKSEQAVDEFDAPPLDDATNEFSV